MGPNWQRQQEQMRQQRQRQEELRRQQERMRRQQEQMREQQERMRRQAQMAAEQRQRQAEAKQRQAPARSESDDKFARVEAEVDRLRKKMTDGLLSEEQFKARLKELMVQDRQGKWWMMGVGTGAWYRYEDEQWVRADPPGRTAVRFASRYAGPTTSSQRTASQFAAQPAAPVKPKPRRFWGIVVLVSGLVLTRVAFAGVAGIVGELTGNADTSLLCAGAIGLVGLVLTVIVTRKVWRRA